MGQDNCCSTRKEEVLIDNSTADKMITLEQMLK